LGSDQACIDRLAPGLEYDMCFRVMWFGAAQQSFE
jgi:hypothetical protein